MRTSRIALLLLGLVAVNLISGSYATGRTLTEKAVARSFSSAKSNDGGSANADSSASSTGGFSESIAIADTQVYADAANMVEDVLKKVLSTPHGTCESLYKTAFAEINAEATAIAQVTVKVFAQVTVEGSGSACASASGEGEAQAVAFADATAAAIVKFLGSNAKASADAVSRVISVGYAKAFAEAFADACSTKGSATAQQTVIAKAIVNPIVEAYALAVVGPTCQNDWKNFVASQSNANSDSAVGGFSGLGDEDVSVISEGSSTADGDSTANAGGSGSAETGQITDEDEIFNIVDQNRETSRCFGRDSFCCTATSFSSLSNFISCNLQPAGDNLWRKPDGTQCHC